MKSWDITKLTLSLTNSCWMMCCRRYRCRNTTRITIKLTFQSRNKIGFCAAISVTVAMTDTYRIRCCCRWCCWSYHCCDNCCRRKSITVWVTRHYTFMFSNVINNIFAIYITFGVATGENRSCCCSHDSSRSSCQCDCGCGDNSGRQAVVVTVDHAAIPINGICKWWTTWVAWLDAELGRILSRWWNSCHTTRVTIHFALSSRNYFIGVTIIVT